VTITVAIADDHPVVLAGLLGLIRMSSDFRVVVNSVSGREALDEIRRLRPDIAIVDYNMPDLSGLAVLKAIRQEALPTQVVLLTASASDAQLLDMMEAGAAAILLKEAAADMLLDCLRSVADFGSCAPSEIIASALERERERRAVWQRLAATLTPRELEIVDLAVAGETNKQIAYHLGVSEGTTKVHLNSIFRKLQVASRAELLALVTGQDGGSSPNQ
jgi:DNA-binding NarL/FixJ family response regulator